jgi:hypothetical protein
LRKLILLTLALSSFIFADTELEQQEKEMRNQAQQNLELKKLELEVEKQKLELEKQKLKSDSSNSTQTSYINYVYKPKSNTNDKIGKIAINPVSLIFGLNIIGDFALTDNFSAGAEYTSISIEDTSIKISGSSLQFNLHYYFKHFSANNWYVKPFYESGSLKGKDKYWYTEVQDITVEYTALGLIFGYQWAWDNSYITLGFGPSKIDTDVKGSYSEEDFVFNQAVTGEFLFGFMF